MLYHLYISLDTLLFEILQIYHKSNVLLIDKIINACSTFSNVRVFKYGVMKSLFSTAFYFVRYLLLSSHVSEKF